MLPLRALCTTACLKAAPRSPMPAVHPTGAVPDVPFDGSARFRNPNGTASSIIEREPSRFS